MLPPDYSPPLLRQWLWSLLLGDALYCAYHGIVHLSDWCYLAAATLVAAGVSAAVVPLNCLLLRTLARRGSRWPPLGRWAGLLGGTAGLFGLGCVFTLPLRGVLGPLGPLPWGAGALLAAVGVNWPLLAAPPRPVPA